jgi:hypothetical protein
MGLKREDFLKGTNILGIITFVNSLKDDARQTVDLLSRN